MIAAELIQEARTAGVALTPLPDGRLQVVGRPQVPPTLKAALQTYKTEVVALLIESEILAAAYRRFWSLPEDEDREPSEAFQAAYKEIVKLEAKADPQTAWRTLRATATAFHAESGVCPFCKLLGELHLPSEQMNQELSGA
jgi:uncharacterized protein YbjT (DUF2867 family)